MLEGASMRHTLPKDSLLPKPWISARLYRSPEFKMKDEARIQIGPDGEYYIISDVINQMGWDEDTILEWFDNEDGSYTIKKVES
jgi:hypothetical protein